MPASASGQPVLAIEGLTTRFATRAGTITPVDGVSLSIMPGQILGLVGESGSGKSMTGYSILGLVDPPGQVVSGSVRLNGRELFGCPPEEMRKLRGNRMAMIFQDPMMTLNPVLRIDTQMMETVMAHQAVGKAQARTMAREALERVGIAAPDERLLAYPHQFSGGMRQRVAIAIALLNKPDLLICDEPTTALDVTIQGQILYEMQKLCRESGTALIWITHDLSVIAGLADQVCVMYAGRIVESGSAEQVLEHPLHPYSHALVESAPSRNPRGQPLRQIPGMTPALARLPAGCAFRERCSRPSAACLQAPALSTLGTRSVRCFHPVTDLVEQVP
jgi:peptide/nickel transport system ATP-binding protein